MTIAHRISVCLSLAAAGLLACLASAGCLYHEPSRLLADTALPGGEFSAQRTQQAYDGEPVTFEMQCAPGAGRYVVFSLQGKDYLADIPQAAGVYRWTRVFHAGATPQTYTVNASPFLVSGKRDWVYNRTTESWDYYPGPNDKPDIARGEEQQMKIICYRATVRFRFKSALDRPEGLVLTLTTDTGQTSRHSASQARTDERRLALAGPDKDGFFEATYTPTHEEVSRTGKTHAKLVVAYAGGETTVLEQDIETP